MKILFLSFYYPPDLSAGSFRVKALVDALCDIAGKDIHIDILTTMPNRYRTHLSVASEVETSPSLSVQRIRIPHHQSGMFDQSKAFAAYAHRVLKETQDKKWDLVVATSSRLMTAALGSYVATRVEAPLYLDIRDLFTDTMEDLLTNSIARLLIPGFRWLEKRTFHKAARVNLVSAGFLAHAKTITPEHNYRLFTNGIDQEFLETDFDNQHSNNSSTPLIIYAGNMGEGQGLHNVLPAAARLLEGKASFRLIGDGGRRVQLQKDLNMQKISNVEIFDPVPRAGLFTHYREADILFLHLNDYDAFRKVLPSKIFEYAATGKPIIAGVAGYAAEFLKKEIEGVQVFSPCDAQGLVQAFENTINNKNDIERESFRKKFARSKIMHDMARDILQPGGER